MIGIHPDAFVSGDGICAVFDITEYRCSVLLQVLGFKDTPVCIVKTVIDDAVIEFGIMGVIVFFIPAADVIQRDSTEIMFRDELMLKIY